MWFILFSKGFRVRCGKELESECNKSLRWAAMRSALLCIFALWALGVSNMAHKKLNTATNGSALQFSVVCAEKKMSPLGTLYTFFSSLVHLLQWLHQQSGIWQAGIFPLFYEQLLLKNYMFPSSVQHPNNQRIACNVLPSMRNSQKQPFVEQLANRQLSKQMG